MTRDAHADPDTEDRSTTIDPATTRRGALGALGATLLSTSAGADGHCDDGGWSWFGGFFDDDDCDDGNGDDPDDDTGGGTGDGSDGDAEVRRDGSTWIAENGGSTVYTGGDMLDAIQAAVDSLTPGRTSEETVVVHDSGTVGPHSWDGDLKTVDLRSNTVLDVRGTITVEDTGDPLVVPVRGLDVDSVEVPNLTVEGNPRFGMRIESCSNVALGDIEMHLSDGLGIRIDDNFAGRTVGVELDSAYSIPRT